MEGLLNTGLEMESIIFRGGCVMNLGEELKAIDDFFDSISDEEFFEMMIDCGAKRILATESIVKEQQMRMLRH